MSERTDVKQNRHLHPLPKPTNQNARIAKVGAKTAPPRVQTWTAPRVRSRRARRDHTRARTHHGRRSREADEEGAEPARLARERCGTKKQRSIAFGALVRTPGCRV